MRYSCKKSVEYDLKLHYKLLDQYTRKANSLSSYKGYILKKAKVRGNKCYYSSKGPGATRFTYIGDESHDQIQRIRERAFYEKAIETIRANIGVMEDFLRIYKSTHAEHINELLGACYTLPPDSLLLRDDAEADAWIKAKNEIKASHEVFDPAGLKITAFDGTLVRSRAEAFIHEAFYIYNVPSIFELPYEIDGIVYWPDFTFLDLFTMTDKMLEHLGNWFHSNEYKRNKYRSDGVHKMDEYTKIGFYPEFNLLLSFGTQDNVFDIQALHRKIAMFASPPPSMETIEMLKRL